MPRTTPDLDLEEQFFVMREAQVRRWVPWLRLLRGFRMAIDYRRMCLALLAVLLWPVGDWLSDAAAANPPVWPWQAECLPMCPATQDQIEFANLVTRNRLDLYRAFGNGEAILWPLQRMYAAANRVLHPATFQGWIQSWLVVLWGLGICGLFGGAIARMAAVEFSARGDLSWRRALRFSSRHFRSYLGAPLIPLFGLALCWIPNLIAGLLGWIPAVGEALLGIFWFLPLIAGALLALILVGVTAAWPLMVAAISTEGGDAFDGLSRSYSYVFNRPWYALFLVVCTVLYGSVLLYFVSGMVTLTVQMTTLSVETGMGSLEESKLLQGAPRHPAVRPAGTTLPASPSIGQTAAGVWMRLLASIPTAFVFSFFWTMATIIYFLLRMREDATPLDEVYLEDAGKRSDLPLVGIPAADVREKSTEADA